MSAIPEKLAIYLQEQVDEGSRVIYTSSEDAYMWIIPQVGLGKWITICIWYEGMEDYELMNIAGKGFDELLKVMLELNK